VNVAPHLFWITSRAAGGAALLLASAAVGAGLMLSARRPGANKRDLRPIHEALSLSTLAMVALHGLSLLGDAYLNPGIAGIAVPFVSAYRPIWTGIGIVAGYGLAALGLTYYVRDRIGAVRWRRLHRLTAVFWIAAIVHTIGAGSDASELWFLGLSGLLVLPAAGLLALRWLGRWWDRRGEAPSASVPPVAIRGRDQPAAPQISSDCGSSASTLT
jgi:sulfoxide reductase heme-binding subunit YedZ